MRISLLAEELQAVRHSYQAQQLTELRVHRSAMYRQPKPMKTLLGEPLQPSAQTVIRHRQTVLGCAGETTHECVACIYC